MTRIIKAETFGTVAHADETLAQPNAIESETKTWGEADLHGRLTALVGLVLRANFPELRVGDLCWIERPGMRPLPALAVGFVGDEAALLPLGETVGVGPQSRVVSMGRAATISCGPGLLGRIVNGMGDPMDGAGPLVGEPWPLDRPPPNPLLRARIREPLATGIRAIDALSPIGLGQRIALLAGPGVGKSTLLGQIARSANVDVVVVALIGERGREVREFVEDTLSAEVRRRAVVVASTADAPALVRLRAAAVATAIAEYFRDGGKRVLLLVDSLTRYARAQREVGLASGEPSVRQGFPPSVFERLPRLCERAGPAAKGTITAVYAVLTTGGEGAEDPIAEEAMAILDGHWVLDAARAASGRFPAIDPVRSLSRVMPSLVSTQHAAAAARVRESCSTLAEKRDLVSVGAYKAGTDRALDRALALEPALDKFLCQARDERVPWAETVRMLESLSR